MVKVLVTAKIWFWDIKKKKQWNKKLNKVTLKYIVHIKYIANQ